MNDYELRDLRSAWMAPERSHALDGLGKRGRDRAARELIPKLIDELLATREAAARHKANYEELQRNAEAADRYAPATSETR